MPACPKCGGRIAPGTISTCYNLPPAAPQPLTVETPMPMPGVYNPPRSGADNPEVPMVNDPTPPPGYTRYGRRISSDAGTPVPQGEALLSYPHKADNPAPPSGVPGGPQPRYNPFTDGPPPVKAEAYEVPLLWFMVAMFLAGTGFGFLFTGWL